MPSFSDVRRQQRLRRDKHRQAVAAVEALAEGKSRAEIRTLLVAELQANDLRTPDDVTLDALAESIANRNSPRAIRHLMALVVRDIAGIGREIARIGSVAKGFREATADNTGYFVPPDHTQPMVEVVLDPGATQEPESKKSVQGDTSTPFEVQLELDRPTNGVVVVSGGTGRLGTLTPTDSHKYELALQRARQDNKKLTVLAVWEQEPANPQRLMIYPAGTAWWRSSS